jgi:cytidyltransferase-like protein
MSTTVIVSGCFDDIKSRHIRFLEEASKIGSVQVQLWSDDAIQSVAGKPAKFSTAERIYFLQAIRFVTNIAVIEAPVKPDELAKPEALGSVVWAVEESAANNAKQAFCLAKGITYRVITNKECEGFPVPAYAHASTGVNRKKVVVTGCYDWFHSGHVRFFEEVSELGDLYVVAGSDKNVELLKGPGHPLFREEERRYIVNSIRYVTQSLISTGAGWMDAEPEIAVIKPDMYAVNEDGDKTDKREFCKTHGLQYVVLKRTPKEGLPKRQSTNLRGF